MKKWQAERNYRRIRNEKGDVIKNIITVDGVDVEVSEEVFLAYSQMERRERYLEERSEGGYQLSLEKLAEDNVLLEYLKQEQLPSAEDVLTEREACDQRRRQVEQLHDALARLSPIDRELIHSLFFEGLSTRACAERLNRSQRAVIKRRDRILRELRQQLDNF